MALDQLSAKPHRRTRRRAKGQHGEHLLVVLCSDRDAQPIVNAGTLYQK